MSNEKIAVSPHPPCSLDLALWGFWFFSKLNMAIKGNCFELMQFIEAATTAQGKTLTKEDSKNCFRKRQNDGISVFQARSSLLRCIITVINYFYFHLLYYAIISHTYNKITFNLQEQENCVIYNNIGKLAGKFAK